MKWILFGVVIIAMVVGGVYFIPTQLKEIPMATLTLTSPVFKNNDFIPAKYTCDGENINPPLQIREVPPEAKTLALIMDDPDAPTGTWDHWVKWNMSPTLSLIQEGKEPEGVSGKGTSRNLTYQGPCPPSGVHHYIFKIYVLDAMLTLPEGSSKNDLLKVIEGHTLAETRLVGLYQKNN